MKRLKITGGDGKTYTFSTFTLREQKALKDKYKEFENLQKDMDKLKFVYDGEKIKKDENGDLISIEQTPEQEKQLANLEEIALKTMVDLVTKSICKVHKEFAGTDNIMDIIGMDELQKIARFAFAGIYIQEEQEIDATISLKDESKK